MSKNQKLTELKETAQLQPSSYLLNPCFNSLGASHGLLQRQSRNIGDHQIYNLNQFKLDLERASEGIWFLAPAGWGDSLRARTQTGVACAISISLLRIAVEDSKGNLIDLTQPLSKDTTSAHGKPIGELGAERAGRFIGLEQIGSYPYRACLELSQKGLTGSQAVFLLNSMLIASELKEPLNVYLPGSEYRVWTNAYARALGVNCEQLVDAHFDILRRQIIKLGQIFYPELNVSVQDTSSILQTDNLEPRRGHWTRTVEKIGLGEELRAIAEQDDAQSTFLFRELRKQHKLFLVQAHATGVITERVKIPGSSKNAKYDPMTDGLHFMLTSAPVLYHEEQARLMALNPKIGEHGIRELYEDINNGEDMGHPLAEFTFGDPINDFLDPDCRVSSAYLSALSNHPGFASCLSLQEALNVMNVFGETER